MWSLVKKCEVIVSGGAARTALKSWEREEGWMGLGGRVKRKERDRGLGVRIGDQVKEGRLWSELRSFTLWRRGINFGLIPRDDE